MATLIVSLPNKFWQECAGSKYNSSIRVLSQNKSYTDISTDPATLADLIIFAKEVRSNSALVRLERVYTNYTNYLKEII